MSITAKKIILILFSPLILMSIVSFASTSPRSETQLWLENHSDFFIEKILENISPPDGLPGSVLAAKSDIEPDYHYHWVRDAALTMMSLIDVYQSEQSGKLKIRRAINDYLDFTIRIQGISNLGEPKFYVNGNVYDKPWGRPQNDGPALRAISLIHWANILIAEGQEASVKQKLYDSSLPSQSPIKKDLEYISHHWKDPSYDLWEEVKGTHFYTLMVIRRALYEGAALAKHLGDQGAADWYQSQARQIEIELQNFWDNKKGYLVATINRTEGVDYKETNLDISVLLGLIHGGMNDSFLAWDNPKVLATINKIAASFSTLYAINKNSHIPGIAIGRYPEDRYSGTASVGGNPWPMCTLAYAESLYAYANSLKMHGQISRSNKIAHYADQFVERVKYHAYPDGSLDEQMNRDTGYMTSARDLTWNYAALLSTRRTALGNSPLTL